MKLSTSDGIKRCFNVHEPQSSKQIWPVKGVEDNYTRNQKFHGERGHLQESTRTSRSHWELLLLAYEEDCKSQLLPLF